MLVSISNKRAWQPLNYFHRWNPGTSKNTSAVFSSKSYYFYILGVSHLKHDVACIVRSEALRGHSDTSVHEAILMAPSCLRSHNARYIMLKSLTIANPIPDIGRGTLICFLVINTSLLLHEEQLEPTVVFDVNHNIPPGILTIILEFWQLFFNGSDYYW